MRPIPPPAYHALLVGIDDYSVKPLRGCVNDIDAVQRLLMDPRIGLDPTRIIRLVAPLAGTAHETVVAAKPPTLANLRAAFADLSSEKVGKTDRVFIYWSGHGLRVPVQTPDGRVFYREALVPVDFNTSAEYRLLFDFEVNRLLGAVAARTPAVTVCLDCCHSGGATRAPPEELDATGRFLDPATELGLSGPLPITRDMASVAEASERGISGSVGECQIVAACLNHEVAQEVTGDDGVRHGLLTRALVTALSEAPERDLRAVTWGRLWQKMRAAVEKTNPWQHLWMAGSPAREVIGGPPVADDPGFAITRIGSNRYQIEAGTFASITPGALIAVYGDKPPRFPPLDSSEDRAARVGDALLKVVTAARSTSLAEADGRPFNLPPGARGRLVRPGATVKLRYALVPQDESLARLLSGSPLLEPAEEGNAEVRLIRGPDDTWVLTNDIHGAKPGYPPLFTIVPDTTPRMRDVLEQYFYYALPLRMATLCTDLGGALQMSLLACPAGRDLTPEEAQAANLPEATASGEFSYDLIAGDKVCVRVRNTSGRRLRVTALNCAASGKVQLLGDQIIDPKSFYVFWAHNDLGVPFKMTPPKGAACGIDRIVAVGTTNLGKDVSYLRLDTTFADVAIGTRGGAQDRDMDDSVTNNPPVEEWTADQLVVRTTLQSAHIRLQRCSSARSTTESVPYATR